MPGMMFECEQKKEFQVGGTIERRWAQVSASLVDGVSRELLRCMHCHGEVRFHKQRQEHGTRDHVEHRSRADSIGCRGGHYFEGGPHRMSLNPVK